jgi:hypothetical protein
MDIFASNPSAPLSTENVKARSKRELEKLDIRQLVELIKDEHRLAYAIMFQACLKSKSHACNVGRALLVVKNKVGYGSFGEWVSKNCGFGERMARVYVQIAKNYRHLKERENGTELPVSISALRAMITVPKKADPAGPPGGAKIKLSSSGKRAETRTNELIEELKAVLQNLWDNLEAVQFGDRVQPQLEDYLQRHKKRSIACRMPGKVMTSI